MVYHKYGSASGHYTCFRRPDHQSVLQTLSFKIGTVVARRLGFDQARGMHRLVAEMRWQRCLPGSTGPSSGSFSLHSQKQNLKMTPWKWTSQLKAILFFGHHASFESGAFQWLAATSYCVFRRCRWRRSSTRRRCVGLSLAIIRQSSVLQAYICVYQQEALKAADLEATDGGCFPFALGVLWSFHIFSGTRKYYILCTSSARASRGRKFQKGQELYSSISLYFKVSLQY